jgi:hypothetical protein
LFLFSKANQQGECFKVSSNAIYFGDDALNTPFVVVSERLCCAKDKVKCECNVYSANNKGGQKDTITGQTDKNIPWNTGVKSVECWK